MALEMRETCERCGVMVGHGTEAYICSYECTFCDLCASRMARICPNCSGELVRRPRRRAQAQPSTKASPKTSSKPSTKVA